jgi:hypothetical protein
VSCEYCQRNAPIYTAADCCKARRKANQAHWQLQREAVRIVRLPHQEVRRAEIRRFAIQHGAEQAEVLKTEILRMWNDGRD